MRRSIAIAATLILLTSCAVAEDSDAEGGSPTPESVASAPSQPSAGSNPAAFEDVPEGSRLEPGTYVLNYSSIGGAEAFPTLAITFTVPDGWERVLYDGLLWNDAGTKLGFLVADNVYADPCDLEGGLRQPAVGASVDDLVAALTNLPGWEKSDVSEDTFLGYSGTRIEVVSPGIGLPCEEPMAFTTIGDPGEFGAPHDEHLVLRVLDVDGTRLLIAEISPETASDDLLAGLQAIVDSVEIQP